MKSRTALLIAWAIFATAIALIVTLGALSAQSDEVPIAGFHCNESVCVTTPAQLQRLMAIWYAMQQKLLECPRGTGI